MKKTNSSLDETIQIIWSLITQYKETKMVDEKESTNVDCKIKIEIVRSWSNQSTGIKVGLFLVTQLTIIMATGTKFNMPVLNQSKMIRSINLNFHFGKQSLQYLLVNLVRWLFYLYLMIRSLGLKTSVWKNEYRTTQYWYGLWTINYTYG